MLSTTHYNVPNLQSLDTLAEDLASQCHSGLIITLSGDLGAGKTTLVRSLLHKLGIHEPIKSPTFTIVEPYQGPNFPIYHFDLYRINDPMELEMIGFRDYLSHESLCLIEWPEKAADYLTHVDWAIRINVDNNIRHIHLTSGKR